MLTIEGLKQEVGWPTNGVLGLASWDVMLKVLGYYLFSLALQRVLPGEEVEGVELSSGGKLKYKFNSMSCCTQKNFSNSLSLELHDVYSCTMRCRHNCSRR